MPIITDFPLPSSPDALNLPSSVFFISFHASVDKATGKAWCPDVVAALPPLSAAFSAEAGPQVAFVEVGQRPEYVSPM
jgi:Eukaryotic protein of unknown function (DUF953)